MKKSIQYSRIPTSIRGFRLPTSFTKCPGIWKYMRKKIVPYYTIIPSFPNIFQKYSKICSIFWILKWIFIPVGELFDFFSKCKHIYLSCSTISEIFSWFKGTVFVLLLLLLLILRRWSFKGRRSQGGFTLIGLNFHVFGASKYKAYMSVSEVFNFFFISSKKSISIWAF